MYGENRVMRMERIHVDIWQNQYNIVKLKNKIKLKKKRMSTLSCLSSGPKSYELTRERERKTEDINENIYKATNWKRRKSGIGKRKFLRNL